MEELEEEINPEKLLDFTIPDDDPIRRKRIKRFYNSWSSSLNYNRHYYSHSFYCKSTNQNIHNKLRFYDLWQRNNRNNKQ